MNRHLHDRRFSGIFLYLPVGYSKIEDALQDQERGDYRRRFETLAELTDPTLDVRRLGGADLTTGNYHGVVAAARTGIEAAPHHSVAIQLSAQEAKAWARIGDRRATEVALDKGRRLLEAMPYPDNLDHHFVVDPTKFDFYSMDCYRHLAEDRLAKTLASEVIQASTDFDGTERAPMRLAEARITLGVVAARQGDLEQAIHYGAHALNAPRKSLPSLLMVSRDLTRILNDQYPNEPETQAYLDQLHALSSLTSGRHVPAVR
jgi:tetratricopeptide (TPR) repeat protein